MTQLINAAKTKLSQSLVFAFTQAWMQSYELGYSNSDCTFRATQSTGLNTSVPEHREIMRRAIYIVINAGFGIN